MLQKGHQKKCDKNVRIKKKNCYKKVTKKNVTNKKCQRKTKVSQVSIAFLVKKKKGFWNKQDVTIL